jgi:hypothetical protein
VHHPDPHYQKILISARDVPCFSRRAVLRHLVLLLASMALPARAEPVPAPLQRPATKPQAAATPGPVLAAQDQRPFLLNFPLQPTTLHQPPTHAPHQTHSTVRAHSAHSTHTTLTPTSACIKCDYTPQHPVHHYIPLSLLFQRLAYDCRQYTATHPHTTSHPRPSRVHAPLLPPSPQPYYHPAPLRTATRLAHIPSITCRHSPFDSRRHARSCPGCTGPEALDIAAHDTTPATPHLMSDTQHRANPRPAHCRQPDTPQMHPRPTPAPPHTDNPIPTTVWGCGNGVGVWWCMIGQTNLTLTD